MGVKLVEHGVDVDVEAFDRLAQLWAGESQRDPNERAAFLADGIGFLEPFARLVAGLDVRLHPAVTGPAQGGVRGLDIFLPVSIAVSRDVRINRGIYVIRAAVSATTASRVQRGVALRNAQDEERAAVAELCTALPILRTAVEDTSALLAAHDQHSLLCGAYVENPDEELADAR